MNRSSTGALIGAVALAAAFLVGAPAFAGDSQTVRGRVTVPTGPYWIGPVAAGACPTADATSAWATGQDHLFGAEFPVLAGTRGAPFTLRADSSSVLSITFRDETRARILGQDGTVPGWADDAQVCLVAGPPASFVYRAG